MNRMTKKEFLEKLSKIIIDTTLARNDEFLLEIIDEFELKGIEARNFLKLCGVHKNDEYPHIYYVLSGDITRRQMGRFFPITVKGNHFLEKHGNL